MNYRFYPYKLLLTFQYFMILFSSAKNDIIKNLKLDRGTRLLHLFSTIINAIIISGIKIGDNVLIGVGAVVVKDIINDVVIAGKLAKSLKN